MKKCIIYDDLFRYNINSPVNILTEYVKNNDFEITFIFEQNINYALNTNENTFCKMEKFLRDNQDIKTIIFPSINSLIVTYDDYLNFVKLNVEMHFVKEAFILNSLDHKDKLLDLLSQNYLNNLSDLIKTNIEYYLSQGMPPFKPPFGYKIVKI